MKPEAQRIAIAEACGYRRDQETGMWENDNPAMRRVDFILPDYPHSLDAMHEAEKHMEGKFAEYDALLKDIIVREVWDEPKQDGDTVYNFHATALMRAEAFLKTLSLWKDEA
jgi:hypothetical protein